MKLQVGKVFSPEILEKCVPAHVNSFPYTVRHCMSGFAKGYVHLTSEQQPFLQGYLPILALCQMKVLGTGAHNQDIGNGFIHTENYKSYIDLAKKGLR